MPIIWFGLSNQPDANITGFVKNLFDLYEIRARVDEKNGITFIVHTNDHNPPHLHVRYGEYEVKISLVDFSIMKGNLPRKKLEFAVNWIKANKDKFLADWARYTNMQGFSVMMKSKLEED